MAGIIWTPGMIAAIKSSGTKSEETKNRMSESHKKYISSLTPEQKELRCKLSFNSEESFRKSRESCSNPEVKARASRKRSRTVSALWKTEEYKKAREFSLETRAKISNSCKLRFSAFEAREKDRKGVEAFWSGPFASSSREAARIRASKQVSLIRKGPNTSEIILGIMLESNFPDTFEYTGSGRIVVSGRIPDYTSLDGRFVVELFGMYWHDPIAFSKSLTPQELVEFYKSNSKSCLVVWECDLVESYIKREVSILLGG